VGLVNEMIAEGWYPLGGPFYEGPRIVQDPARSQHVWISQAFVKYAK
jgi:hypothetical protein